MIRMRGRCCQIRPLAAKPPPIENLARYTALGHLDYIRLLTSRVDGVVAVCLVPLAIWVLLNGLDDLVIDFACACSWLAERFFKRTRFHRPLETDLDAIQ